MSQCHVLLTIYEQKETTMVELSKELAINKSNLSRIIDSLVKLRYIERVPSKKDRRYSKIKVTAKGKSKSSEINKSATTHYRKVFENIPEWKHKEIVENLTLLTLAFSAEENILLNKEDQEDTCCE
jgi:DNA-binding MarR family transcriptional regulator